MSGTEPRGGTPTPREAVAGAVQNLVAARLGRGFVPLALVGAVGVLGLATGRTPGASALPLILGAAASACAMLAYGLRTVQRAVGRRPRLWMRAAALGSLLPPAFGLYVVGWPGLRAVSTAGGIAGVVAGATFVALGVWLLRSWLKIVEVERLARVMTSEIQEHGGPP